MERMAPDEPEDVESALRRGRPADPRGLERRMGLDAVFRAVGVEPDEAHRIGRYQIARRLGAGAMGTVFEARDPELDRLVAIKVLRANPPEPGDDPHLSQGETDEGAAIMREARTLARLNHPHVVGIYDVGETDGQIFIAMEHMASGSLTRYLAREQPKRWTDVIRLFVEAGRGLAAAHAAGIIHRDFKTDNILVDGRGVAKVADFGLARIAVEPGAGPQPYRYVVGTRAYMAPELMDGVSAGPRSDQYSFCASLLSELSAHAQSVPANVRAALTRGMRDDADERWPSLEPLLELLERALSQPRGDRRRLQLIDRVHRIWIEGVLDASLDGRPQVSLAVEHVSDLVDSPWAHAPRGGRNTARSLRTDDLPTLLESSNGALLVVGGAGSGKTTAILGLARSLLESARHDDFASVPVVLNLSSFSGRTTLAAWVEAELVAKYRLPRRRVERWLETDDLALILDGLDELSASRRARCIRAINEFRGERPVPIVVACREEEYRASGLRLALGTAVRICPLDEQATDEWGLDQTLSGSTSDERLRTPLWVALANSQFDLKVARSWDGVYDDYLNAALKRSPSLDGRRRDLCVARLRWLARNMARLRHSEVWLDRIQYRWLPGAGRQMLAMLLSTLALLIPTVGCSILASLSVGRSALSGFFLGVGGFGIVLALNRGLRVNVGERLRWSWRTMNRRAPVMIAMGIGVAVFYALAMDRPLGAMLYLGVTGGSVAGLLLGLGYADRTRGLRPGDSLALAARQAAVVGSVGAVTVGLAYVLIIGPIYGSLFPSMLDAYPGINVSVMLGVTLGTVVGTSFGLVYGGAAIVLHGCYRLTLWLTSPMPLRLIGWLDDMTKRGLMRRIGGGYMFMHATLLESLARPAGRRRRRESSPD